MIEVFGSGKRELRVMTDKFSSEQRSMISSYTRSSDLHGISCRPFPALTEHLLVHRPNLVVEAGNCDSAGSRVEQTA